MDSRSGFSVLLIVAGITIVWLALTGKAQAVISAIQNSNSPSTSAANTSGTASDPGHAAPAAGAGGSWAPTSTTGGSGAIAAAPNDLLTALAYEQLLNSGSGINATPYSNPIGSVG